MDGRRYYRPIQEVLILYGETMANFTEKGQTGLSQYNGIIKDDFLREFTGKEAYKRFNEMRLNSSIIASGLSAVEYIIRRMSWNFSEGEGEDDPRHELLEDARKAMSMSWNDHISEALTFIVFGFYVCEKIYQRDDKGRILWRKFATRGQDTVYRWEFDKNGGIEAMVQMAAPNYDVITLPIKDLLIYRTRLERGNPEGRSLLRPAWIPYYYTKNLQQIEAIGFERDLNGLPVIKLPEGADTAETDTSDLGKAQKMVRNLRNDEQAGATLPFGWDLLLLSGAGKGFSALADAIKRYESRTAMVFFTQSLLLGQDGVGSLALSTDMKNFLITFADAIADIIAETFSKYAIPDLLRLNGYTGEESQGIKLEHTPAGDVDITKVADGLQKITNMLTWDENDESWLRQMVGLPEKEAVDIKAGRDVEDAKKQEEARKIKEEVDKEVKANDMMKAEQFKSNAKDDYKRRQMERKLEEMLTEHLAATKRRVLKEAKAMQGSNFEAENHGALSCHPRVR